MHRYDSESNCIENSEALDPMAYLLPLSWMMPHIYAHATYTISVPSYKHDGSMETVTRTAADSNHIPEGGTLIHEYSEGEEIGNRASLKKFGVDFTFVHTHEPTSWNVGGVPAKPISLKDSQEISNLP